MLGEREELLQIAPSFPKAKDMRIRLDVAGSSVVIGDKTAMLSPKEMQVMKCLLDRRGDAVTREEIAAVIGESSANKTEVYVCFLRKKLEECFGDRIIKTERGKGYKIPQ